MTAAAGDQNKSQVLVPAGVDFIGSHCVIELIKAGYESIVVDNLYNSSIGTGKGYSVLEMIKALEKASGKTINYKECPRRLGDLASVYADPALTTEELDWKAERGLDDMCRDLWRWQSNNPNGFQ